MTDEQKMETAILVRDGLMSNLGCSYRVMEANGIDRHLAYQVLILALQMTAAQAVATYASEREPPALRGAFFDAAAAEYRRIMDEVLSQNQGVRGVSSCLN